MSLQNSLRDFLTAGSPAHLKLGAGEIVLGLELKSVTNELADFGNTGAVPLSAK